MLHITRKISCGKKKAYLTKNNQDPGNQDLFAASRVSCGQFMRRHWLSLSLRRKTATAEKYPSIIDRKMSYVMHGRRIQKQFSFHNSNIIAMHETLVRNDMVFNTTVKVTATKKVTVKSTGHDKVR